MQSHVGLFKPHLVTAVCTDMTMFDHLKTVWKFENVPTHKRMCRLDFAVSFAFRYGYRIQTQNTDIEYYLNIYNFMDIPIYYIFFFRKKLHSYLAQKFLDDVIKQNVNAFLKEAQNRYGKEIYVPDEIREKYLVKIV